MSDWSSDVCSSDLDTLWGDTEGNVDGINGDDDILHGGGEDDVMYGGGGNDTLYGDAGNDTMYGGAGDDVFYVTEAGDVVYGGAGTDTVYATVGIALANFDSVENVTLTANRPGNITGNDDDNVLKGNSSTN